VSSSLQGRQIIGDTTAYELAAGPGCVRKRGAQWFTDGSEEHHLLEASVNMLKRMATAEEGAKYVLRVEIRIREQVKVHGSYSAT
jgi:hypothetical protein